MITRTSLAWLRVPSFEALALLLWKIAHTMGTFNIKSSAACCHIAGNDQVVGVVSLACSL